MSRDGGDFDSDVAWNKLISEIEAKLPRAALDNEVKERLREISRSYSSGPPASVTGGPAKRAQRGIVPTDAGECDEEEDIVAVANRSESSSSDEPVTTTDNPEAAELLNPLIDNVSKLTLGQPNVDPLQVNVLEDMKDEKEIGSEKRQSQIAASVLCETHSVASPRYEALDELDEQSPGVSNVNIS